MYGAITGDIIGSQFEFDRGNKSREFELFGKNCVYTDDTVMTVAVAEALMDAGRDADEKTIKDKLITSLKSWGQRYPHAGYGNRFKAWVLSAKSVLMTFVMGGVPHWLPAVIEFQLSYSRS